MDFNVFKDEWRKATMEINPSAAQPKDALSPKGRTSLDRLASRYLGFSRMSFCVSVATPAMLGAALYVTDFPMPAWLVLCFEAYFLLASTMDYWLYRRIRDIDCSVMKVEEVLRLTMRYRKRHLQFMLILMPMAVALLIGMGIYLRSDRSVIYGMIAGALIGLAIGIRYLIEFMRDYRRVLG